MSAMVKWIIGAVVGVVIVIMAFIQIDPKVNNQNSNDVVVQSSIEEGKIQVTIQGQVAHPGTYTIDENLTINDLVELAGGYLSSADLDAINGDVNIKDISLVYVPMLSGYSQSCVIDPNITKVNLNTASVEELVTINGISQTLAERIVAYRNENGEFKTLEELMNVVGIGTKTYEKIRDSLTLK